MSKDSSDFALQEHDKILNAIFRLQEHISEWFKVYLTLVSLPLTIMAATLRLSSNGEAPSISELPDVVSGLLLVVGFLGLFSAMVIVDLNMRRILYARAVNCVRRYFVVQDRKKYKGNTNQLSNFLVLPNHDGVPPFFKVGRDVFWQVITMGVLDGLIIAIAVNNLVEKGFLKSVWGWWGIFVFFAFVHFFVYWFIANRRDKNWNKRHEENIGSYNN